MWGEIKKGKAMITAVYETCTKPEEREKKLGEEEHIKIKSRLLKGHSNRVCVYCLK